MSLPFDIKTIRENNSNPMLGETLNADFSESSVGTPHVLPKRLLYSIFARIGGHGLDTDSFEALRASYRGKFLGKAVAYDNRQTEIPTRLIQSLRWHPVRLISFIGRPYYYGAKKKYLDRIASRHLETGRYDFFHSWSGDCLETLRVAKKKKIPSLIEIPTWHRGSQKPEISGQPSEVRKSFKSRLLLERERFLEEYDLATLVVVLSEKAAESFRAASFPDEKLFYLPRGVDVDRFKPGSEPDGRKRPPIFRAIFSGALIERKGIHHLLEAWHRLNLRDAELWLLGSVHEEAKHHLKKFGRENVRVLGFKRDLENYLNQGSVYVFPSRLEGSAKTIYEAAACGLPMITTREAGDVVRDGVEGIIVQPGDVDAIAAAIEHLYRHPEIVASMGTAARQRVVDNFTWDHYRTRLLGAYERAIQMSN
ncbi:MAG TPA: glycosyltransferase family 4 protein [Chthoniobacterales bacterium]|nr:glycosyltransferase family 4 protein [Chthoniobacterales bacterium]